MTFPTIPTVGAGRVLTTVQANATSPRTFPNLSSLTKNAGDLLVAIIVGYQSSLTSAIFSSWGAGFTEVKDIGVASQHCVGVAYKFSDGTETGTFTVAQAGTITGHAGMILLSIPNVHPSSAPEVSAALATGTAAAADPAALAPSWGAADTLWIAVRGSGETSTTGSYTGLSTPPTNYSDSAQTGISGDVVGGVEAGASFRQNNTASEDVGAGTCDTSNARNCAIVIAVRPDSNATGSGGVTFAAPALAGTGAEEFSGSGGVTIPKPVIDGTAAEEFTGSGGIAITKPTLDATGSVDEASEPTGSGGVTISAPGLAGTGSESMSGAGGITITKPTLSGSAVESMSGSGGVAITKPTLASTGSTWENVSGAGAVTIAPPALSGIGEGGEVAVEAVAYGMVEEGSGAGPVGQRRSQTPFDDWTIQMDDEAILELYVLKKGFQ